MTEIAASFVAEWRGSGDDATRKKVAWSTLSQRLQAADLEVDILEDALLQVESLEEGFSNTCILEYVNILEWAATKHPRLSMVSLDYFDKALKNSSDRTSVKIIRSLVHVLPIAMNFVINAPDMAAASSVWKEIGDVRKRGLQLTESTSPTLRLHVIKLAHAMLLVLCPSIGDEPDYGIDCRRLIDALHPILKLSELQAISQLVLNILVRMVGVNGTPIELCASINCLMGAMRDRSLIRRMIVLFLSQIPSSLDRREWQQSEKDSVRRTLRLGLLQLLRSADDLGDDLAPVCDMLVQLGAKTEVEAIRFGRRKEGNTSVGSKEDPRQASNTGDKRPRTENVHSIVALGSARRRRCLAKPEKQEFYDTQFGPMTKDNLAQFVVQRIRTMRLPMLGDAFSSSTPQLIGRKPTTDGAKAQKQRPNLQRLMMVIQEVSGGESSAVADPRLRKGGPAATATTLQEDIIESEAEEVAEEEAVTGSLIVERELEQDPLDMVDKQTQPPESTTFDDKTEAMETKVSDHALPWLESVKSTIHFSEIDAMRDLLVDDCFMRLLQSGSAFIGKTLKFVHHEMVVRVVNDVWLTREGKVSSVVFEDNPWARLLLDFISLDPTNRIDLAISWCVDAMSLDVRSSFGSLPSFETPNKLYEVVVQHVGNALLDRGNEQHITLPTFFENVPDVVPILGVAQRSLEQEHLCDVGISIMCRSAIERKVARRRYLDALLSCATSNSFALQMCSIRRMMKELFDLDTFKNDIIAHATEQFNALRDADVVLEEVGGSKDKYSGSSMEIEDEDIRDGDKERRKIDEENAVTTENAEQVESAHEVDTGEVENKGGERPEHTDDHEASEMKRIERELLLRRRIEEQRIRADELVKQKGLLFFLTTARQHEQLQLIVDVYASAKCDVIRNSIRMNVRELIGHFPSSDEYLLENLRKHPAEASPLLLYFVYVLAEKYDISEDLVRVIEDLYESKTVDHRFLVPIIARVKKGIVVDALKDILTSVGDRSVHHMIDQLLEKEKSQFLPLEVLVHVLSANVPESSIMRQKSAVDYCLKKEWIFTRYIVASALQRIVDSKRIPKLFLATLLQVCAKDDTMLRFGIQQMIEIIRFKPWKDSFVWKGFKLFLNHFEPETLVVLNHLPPDALEQELSSDDEMRHLFAHYVARNEYPSSHQHLVDTYGPTPKTCAQMEEESSAIEEDPSVQ